MHKRSKRLAPSVLVFGLTLAILFGLSGCDLSSNSPDPAEIRQDAAQLLIVGFRGKTVQEANRIVQDIEQLGIGGVILFDRDVALKSDRNISNPIQLRQLVTELQWRAGNSLLVAIDQEGGYVNRLKPDYGFPPTHSALYFGQLDQPEVTRSEAEQTARTLRGLGINLNFAPVVDLNINPDSPAIGRWERSYSADPEVVIRQATAVIDAHAEQGVANALKHFPGHGSATADSHQGFVDITDTWQPVELTPYRRLVTEGKVPVVMTAHVYNAHLDPEYPATLSRPILTGLLREEIGFDGLIVTDDMQMGAIADEYGLETAIEKALNAGVDMLIFANNLEYDPDIARKAVDLIEQMVLDGRISAHRLREAADRVCQLKSQLNLACQP
ncbi:MAG: glycoside hydrolase family 3 protein [Halothiobacillaceae bacterium]